MDHVYCTGCHVTFCIHSTLAIAKFDTLFSFIMYSCNELVVFIVLVNGKYWAGHHHGANFSETQFMKCEDVCQSLKMFSEL